MQACPSCEKVDRVQKVSAIVNEGNVYGTSSTGQTVHSSSALASHLELPEKPNVNISVNSDCLGWILIGAVLWIAFFGLCGLFNWLNNPNRDIGVLWGAVIIGLIVLLIWYLIDRSITQRLRAKQKALLPSWNNIKNRWDRAYYCHRCGVVYIEGESRCVPLESFTSLLNG